MNQSRRKRRPPNGSLDLIKSSNGENVNNIIQNRFDHHLVDHYYYCYCCYYCQNGNKNDRKKITYPSSSSSSSLSSPSSSIFLCPSSYLLMFIIVLYVAIFDLIINSTRAMASNPYISGIKLPGNQIEDQTFYGEVKSLIGGRAELPCNLTLPSPDDAIQLIFWHRGNNTRVPIYTVDSRASTSLANATHFLSDIFAPNRAVYDVHSKPSVLRIDPVLETDHSDYRCRVDFRWGRTINSFVSLHVIVPPKRITIRDQNGNYVQNSTIGPYDQYSDVVLTCESNGGIPPPTLQWYKNGVMMDGSYVVGENGIVTNELTIYKLSPHDLYDKYVCQAGNFNSSSSTPIEAYVVLDINLLPIDVRILTNRSRLIAGRKVDIRCETYGSKPAAIIKWYRNDKLLSHSTETYESNKTTSSITLMPTVQDNNALLQCRAYNPRLFSTTTMTTTSKSSSTLKAALPFSSTNHQEQQQQSTSSTNNGKYLESVWKLEILYSPQVTLTIKNQNFHPNKIINNQTFVDNKNVVDPKRLDPRIQQQTLVVVNAQTSIMIECHVSANPSIVDIQILHNSTIIQTNKQFDVQDQNVTKYMIDSVNGSHHGRYQCIASNQQGITRSNIIQLDVLYAPFCKDNNSKSTVRLPFNQRWLNKTDSNLNNKKFDSSNVSSKSVSASNHEFALALNESVRLKCNVESNPPATQYYWTLNSEWLDESHIIAQSKHDNELLYTAKTSDNYGKVLCWASNQIGVQQEPCHFVINKAGPPSSLHGCSVTNKTTTSLTVECFPGDNGGSKQIFHAHIYQSDDNIDDADDDDDDDDDDEDVDHKHEKADPSMMMTDDGKVYPNQKPLTNKQAKKKLTKTKQQPNIIKSTEMNLTSESSPIFYLNNLTPGTSYMIELYGRNERGQSEIFPLSVTTLFTKNTKLISSSLHEYEYDSWFSVLIGFLLTILLAVVAIYIVCRVRQRQINRLKNRRKEEQIKQNFAFCPPNNPTTTTTTKTSNQSYLDEAVVDIMNPEDKDVLCGDADLFQHHQTTDNQTTSTTTSSTTMASKTNSNNSANSNNHTFGPSKQQPVPNSSDIISFDSATDSNSKVSLYVIKEDGTLPGAHHVPSSSSSSSNQHSSHHYQHQQPIQLATGPLNSFLIGADPNVHSAGGGNPGVSQFGGSKWQTSYLATPPQHHHQLTFLTAPTNPASCLIPQQSSQFQHQSIATMNNNTSMANYYINATPTNPAETATILYTSAAIQPQILSLNNNIDGIVLSSNHGPTTTTVPGTDNAGYYQCNGDGQSTITSSSATPEAVGATTTILLHHPPSSSSTANRFNHHPMATQDLVSSTDEDICEFNLQQTAV